jgi:hypothetical protein
VNDRYIILSKTANEIRKHITNLIMRSTDLSMNNRVMLIKSLNIRVIGDNISISSTLGEKFKALNDGSRTFTKPYRWVQKAMEKAPINVDSIVAGIVGGGSRNA